MNIYTLLRYSIQNLKNLCDIDRVIELKFLIISLQQSRRFIRTLDCLKFDRVRRHFGSK